MVLSIAVGNYFYFVTDLQQMSAIFSTFRSGGHFVEQNRNICVILVEFTILKLCQPFRRGCHLKIFSIFSFSGHSDPV